MRRGEVWWATLPAPRGSEPGFDRPVLVISDDRFNRSAIRTVIVATVTSSRNRRFEPGAVRVPQRRAGLDRPSVVNITQLTTLDKRALVRKLGRIPRHVMERVDHGLRVVLSLEPSST